MKTTTVVRAMRDKDKRKIVLSDQYVVRQRGRKKKRNNIYIYEKESASCGTTCIVISI